MSLLVNLSQFRRLVLRASIMVSSLVFGIFLFNALAVPQPVYIDDIEKPSYVEMEYSFSAPDYYYPEHEDDLVPTNNWAYTSPYTNFFTSPTTVDRPGPSPGGPGPV